jgi:exodeoxyribonuclease-3
MAASTLNITTWNVNSIKARLPRVESWVQKNAPDVLCLQEIKCQEDMFPYEAFDALGYHAIVTGQKTYNGVAILLRHNNSSAPSFNVREKILPGDKDDEQARYLEIDYHDCVIACLYLPNGNPIGTDKFSYKIKWMDRLYQHAKNTLLYQEKPVILCGDFNVIPNEKDCYDPEAWKEDALFQKETRRAFRAIKNLGFVDAYDEMHPKKEHAYTFWDYQKGRWFKDQGIRIDHFLINGKAADKAQTCAIDRDERGQEKASDHVPVTLQISLA